MKVRLRASDVNQGCSVSTERSARVVCPKLSSHPPQGKVLGPFLLHPPWIAKIDP